MQEGTREKVKDNDKKTAGREISEEKLWRDTNKNNNGLTQGPAEIFNRKNQKEGH